MKPRFFDYLFIAFYLGVVVFLFGRVYGGSQGSETLLVEASGKSYVYTLDKDRTIEVSGPLGSTILKIADGEAFFVESPCRDKLCVKSPPLVKSGDWSACMPNKVFIRIEGKKKDVVDDLSY